MTLPSKTIATLAAFATLATIGTLTVGTPSLAAAPLSQSACAPYSVTVLVDGVAAPEYASRGRIYIEALKGRNFSLILSNPTSERVAVALSVDGRNVIDAKRTSPSAASKWILMPGQSAEIPGWQVSGDTSRRFFFTETRRSYAQWLGDTSNVGTIEAVFYREREHPRTPIALAPIDPQYRTETERRDPLGKDSANRQPAVFPPPPGSDAPASAADSRAAGKSQAQAAPAPGEPGNGGNLKPKAATAPSSRARESDSFAATGIGERTSFSVTRIPFDEDPTPAARVALRYEFRAELLRLGVLRSEDDLYARDRGRGFEREYAPDPYRNR